MITDSETNLLYLADTLPLLYPDFHKRLEKLLVENKIEHELIPNTKDIWAVDYMPIQINKYDFRQFVYEPDYLKKNPYDKSKSDVDFICEKINIKRRKSSLVIDGGNIIRSKNKIIMCDKVFNENKFVGQNQLISELHSIFETDKIIFIPWDKNDFTGHADGMVRFIDNDLVAINERTGENTDCENSLREILWRENLEYIELPYKTPSDTSYTSAKGLHLNYLQLSQTIIVPIFNTETDERAVKQIEEIFKGQTILTIESNEIAAQGGVLNCISWNIFTNSIND